MKKIVLVVAKFSLAFFLVYWLLQSGKIDMSVLTRSREHPGRWLLCIMVMMINIALTTWRWKIILEVKSEKHFSFLSILRLNWIGCLFNTILPGAVSGDIIKLLYVHKIDRKLSKIYLVSSILLDRFIGLFALLLLMGFFSLINFHDVMNFSSQVFKVLSFNLFIAAMMGIVFSLFFVPEIYQLKFLQLPKKIPLLGVSLRKIMPQMWLIGKNKKTMMMMVLMSICAHFLSVFTFWFLASPYFAYANHTTPLLTLQTAYTFIPLGFVALAIPLTPAGLGVGHATFSTLFSYFGIVNGASVFNLHFFASVFVSLLGIFPYLKGSERHSSKDLQDFELEISPVGERQISNE